MLKIRVFMSTSFSKNLRWPSRLDIRYVFYLIYLTFFKCKVSFSNSSNELVTNYSVSVYFILLKGYFRSHVENVGASLGTANIYTRVCVDQLNHLVLFHTFL